MKGLDIQDVCKNVVQRVNATDLEARRRKKVICWTKFGPVDLTDKKQPICTEMFNYYHYTITMNTEVCSCYDPKLPLRLKSEVFMIAFYVSFRRLLREQD